eukprot:1872743-Rhodomonas_salina.1
MFCSPYAAKVPYWVRVSTMEICCEAELTTRVPVGSMSRRPTKSSRESVRFPSWLRDLLILYSSASGMVILARWTPE